MIDYDALPEQRQEVIYQMLQQTGRVIGADIARQLGVSEHTIRRDLQAMVRKGMCKKVYGGAVSQFKQSASFETRVMHSIEEKTSVAKSCAELIKPGTCIFIDGGSTYLAMVEFIPPEYELTIVTNSPQIAAALSGRLKGEVIMLGGKLNAQTGSVLGSQPLEGVREMLFDQMFIGVCGLDIQAGLTAVYYEDACFKKEVMRQSNEIIAAVIADKMPQVARYKVASCEDIDIVVASSLTETDSLAHTSVRLVVAG
ncbi:DeoR/GlpR family DNA-binding transcription regulator [Erwiniaceae bacterium BAC15a-03b]|uniref:DeoR/GlpR family DNA-binding transcription regulator n=1 Tax=Winslowiella arboricola TaxID=2978220 RepID=A0A9J6PY45_9GAMM|nr:DeoR/GlpR family DNA-binding transcription regulator [Winslowiella arboricola]MCU5774380.1 DeoR/GlpR family DNA-binding transcription regulator [Winslowiella arboricola]MCU5778927.1 DeoR/GlpR family DNA-binding transcription regulator [Winslowiella arboricola]